MAESLCSSPCPIAWACLVPGLGRLAQWRLPGNLAVYTTAPCGCLDRPHSVAVSVWLHFFPDTLPGELGGSYEASCVLASEFSDVTFTRLSRSSMSRRPAQTITPGESPAFGTRPQERKAPLVYLMCSRQKIRSPEKFMRPSQSSWGKALAQWLKEP